MKKTIGEIKEKLTKKDLEEALKLIKKLDSYTASIYHKGWISIMIEDLEKLIKQKITNN